MNACVSTNLRVVDVWKLCLCINGFQFMFDISSMHVVWVYVSFNAARKQYHTQALPCMPSAYVMALVV